MESLTRHRLLEGFYMAGGTAAALQLGHRLSHDFDFFTASDFDTSGLIQRMRAAGDLELTAEAAGMVHGTLGGVRLSFIHYRYPLLFPTKCFEGVHLADLRDIALMTATGISSRGSKRDFIDLYVICTRSMPLSQLMNLLDRKHEGVRYSRYHLIRSLAFFEDAERDVDPVLLMRDISWPLVRKFFMDEQAKFLAGYRP